MRIIELLILVCNLKLLTYVVRVINRDFQLVKDLNVDLKYVINTHLHADHVTGKVIVICTLTDANCLNLL